MKITTCFCVNNLCICYDYLICQWHWHWKSWWLIVHGEKHTAQTKSPSPVQTNNGNERLYPPVSLVTLMTLLYLLHIPGHLIQATAQTSLLIQRVSPGLAGEKKTWRCLQKCMQLWKDKWHNSDNMIAHFKVKICKGLMMTIKENYHQSSQKIIINHHVWVPS